MTRCEKGFSEIRSPGKFTTRTSQPAIIQWICLVNWITKIQSNPSYQTHIPATYHNVPQIWIDSPIAFFSCGSIPPLIVEQTHHPWFILWLFFSYYRYRLHHHFGYIIIIHQPQESRDTYPIPQPWYFIHLVVSWNRGTPYGHPFSWDLPSTKTHHFGYLTMDTSISRRPVPAVPDQGATQGHIHKRSWVQMGHHPPKALGSRPPNLAQWGDREHSMIDGT